MELFEGKVRKVGTSLGLLIPKEVAKEDNLREGQTVKVAIIKKNVELINKMFGSVKAKGFKREHADRAI